MQNDHTLSKGYLLAGLALASGITCTAFYATWKWLSTQASFEQVTDSISSSSMGQAESNSSRPFMYVTQPVQCGDEKRPFRRTYEQVPSEDAVTTANERLTVPKLPIRIIVNPQMELDEMNVNREKSTSSESGSGRNSVSSVSLSTSESFDGDGNRRIRSDSLVTDFPSHLRGNNSLLSKVSGFSAVEFQESLAKTLDNVYHSNRPLSAAEARSVVLMLQQPKSDLLLKALTAMGNQAAFASNQDLFREKGGITALTHLLENRANLSDAESVMLMQCIANMAVNRKNLKLLKLQCLPLILESLETAGRKPSELQILTCLRALRNLTVDVEPQDVSLLARLIPRLYDRLGSSNLDQNLILAFGLLVNLSCSPELVPFLLNSKVPHDFWRVLDPRVAGEDLLLRSISFLCNVTATVATIGLESVDCDETRPQSLKDVLYGSGRRQTFSCVVRLRLNSCEEIRLKAERTISALAHSLTKEDNS